MAERPQDPEGGTSDLHWRIDGVRYTTGLTIYDEALIAGRWVGRYLAANGFAEVEENVVAGLDLAHQAHLPTQAFDLTIDGQAMHFGWRMVETGEQPPDRPGTRHAVVTLAHLLRPVVVRIHTVLDGGPVLERWLEITNTGEQPAALVAVAPWGGVLMRVRGGGSHGALPGHDGHLFSIGRFVDPAWGNEGDFVWESLPWGTLRLEGRRGRSGRPAPFFIIRNEATGELAIGELGWSGNWSIECTCEEDQATGAAWLAWWAGPQAPAPMRVLAVGETVATPTMHLGYLHGDLDDAVQAMHAHVRSSVILPQPEGRADRVVYNHWSYARHELSEPVLLHEIDVAHAVGAELFIVDAGWFGHSGSNWVTTVGDWEAGDRLPNGLEPIFGHARARGLLYGLWMDAERIGPESRIAREHPDWLLQRDGMPVGSALDLLNSAAAAWLEGEINRLVDRYDLDLFRLDYNTDVGEGGYRMHAGYYENSLWRHYEVLYGIFDRLHARRPDLLLENCASGGGRTDLGLLRRFHYTWITDWPALPRSIKIFNGMTLALPPEACDRNAGVGQDGHLQGDLTTQIRSCLLGHFTLTGIYPPGERGDAAHLAHIRRLVVLYKERIRPWLRTSRVYHHTPLLRGREPGGWCAIELIAADRQHGAAGIFRLAGPGESEYSFRPRGLDLSRRYRVTYDNSGQSSEWAGAALMEHGLTVRLDRPLASELLLLEAL